VLVLLVANSALVTTLTGAGLGLLTAKLLTETALFAASYLVQRLVVFARPEPSIVVSPDRSGVASRGPVGG
jgi:hypothetical protein